MARARLLKPGFFTNDELAEIPFVGRLLFAGLWTLADRAGRLEDRPRRIKAEIFPYDDVDADALLSLLAERGFVIRYEANGVRYLQVTNFVKHQTPHIKEAVSVIPAPDEHDACTMQAPDEHDTSPSSRARAPIPVTRSLNQKPIPEAEAERKPPRARGRESAAVPNASYRLFARFCEESGTDEASIPAAERGKQMAHAKAILVDYTEDEAVACYGYLASQSWRTGLIDLGTVRAEIGKWKVGGSPARERPRARAPNGNGRIAANEANLREMAERDGIDFDRIFTSDGDVDAGLQSGAVGETRRALPERAGGP